MAGTLQLTACSQERLTDGPTVCTASAAITDFASLVHFGEPADRPVGRGSLPQPGSTSVSLQFPIGATIVGRRCFGTPTPSAACCGRSSEGGLDEGTGSSCKRRREGRNE
jgi:hypothetical protein